MPVNTRIKYRSRSTEYYEIPTVHLVPVVVNGKQMEQKPARAARAGLQGLGDPESAPVRRRKARYVGAFAGC